jgi:hypothetical protein
VILSTNKGGQQLVCYVCAERQASCTLKNSFYRFRIEYLYIHVYIYIYIKSKAIYQPENLMSNGSSRHDDAAQTKYINNFEIQWDIYIIFVCLCGFVVSLKDRNGC